MNHAIRRGLTLLAALVPWTPSAGQSLEAGDLLVATRDRIVKYGASTGLTEDAFAAAALAAANGGAAPLLSGEILYDDHQAYLYFSGTGGEQRLYRADVGEGLISLADEDLLVARRGLDEESSLELTGKAIPLGGALLYLDRSNGGALIGLELRTGIHSVYATGDDFAAFSAAEGAGMTSFEFVSLDFDPESGDYLLLAGGASLDANGDSRPALYRVGSDGQPTEEISLGNVDTNWEQVLAAPGGGAYVLRSTTGGRSLLQVTGTTRTELLGPADLEALFGAGVEVAPALTADPTGRLYLLAGDGTVIRIDPTAGDIPASASEIISAQDYVEDTGIALSGALGLAYVSSAPVSYEVTQSSSPAGIVTERTFQVIENRFFTPSNPSIVSGGNRLGFWSVNGVRASAAGGRGLLRPTVRVTEDLEIVAQYFATGVDSDGDRLRDWWELWMFGDLTRGPQDNEDGDAFNHEEEFGNGYDATVQDLPRSGGIAARASASITFVKANAFRYRLRSAPFGLLEAEDEVLPTGSAITTPNLFGATNGHTFVGWEVDGQRIAGPGGVYRRQLNLQPTTDIEVVARYVPTGEDSDNDGLPDWYELQNFGNLAQDRSSDPDQDGLDIASEIDFGFSPTLRNSVVSGGIAARASAPITYAVGRSLYSVESIPFGLIDSTSEFVEDGTERTTTSFSFGNVGGMAFGYWSINGERVADPTGIARRQVATSVEGATRLRAHFFTPGQDSDADGIEDVIEWRYQGNLDVGRDDDPDEDGLLLGEELDFGFAPSLKETIYSGGIAGRSSASIVFNNSDRRRYEFRTSPLGLADSTSEFLESGMEVTSPSYRFGSGYNGYRFTHFTRNGERVETSAGQSRLEAVFNLEEDTELVANFTPDDVDSDEDGILDYIELRIAENFSTLGLQSDPDNDGLTMADELTWGTSGIIADRFHSGGIGARASYVRPITLDVAPSGIALAVSSIMVDSPIGSEVGQLIPVGGNPSRIFTFQLVNGAGDDANVSFTISGDRLVSSVALAEAGELPIRVRATDSEGLTFEQELVIRVIQDTPATYGDFLVLNFTPAQAADAAVSGPESDPDQDGIANLLEYAHGLDPFLPNPSPFEISGTSSPENPGPRAVEFEFPWRTGTSDLTYTLERVTRLDGFWSDVPTTVISSEGDDGVARLVVRAELLGPYPKTEFFRLRVVK